MRRFQVGCLVGLWLLFFAGCTTQRVTREEPGSAAPTAAAPALPAEAAPAMAQEGGPADEKTGAATPAGAPSGVTQAGVESADPAAEPREVAVAREADVAAKPIVPAFPEAQVQKRLAGLSPVYFGFDASSLAGRARKTLEANVVWLRNNPGLKVRLEGHCDERGTSEYNLALGIQRAQRVRDFLRARGISGERLTTATFGEEVPMRRGHNEAAYRLNRRVEFVRVETTALLER